MLTQPIRLAMLDVLSALRSVFQRQPREQRLSATDPVGALHAADPHPDTCPDPTTCTQPGTSVVIPDPLAPFSPQPGAGVSLPWVLPQGNASSPAPHVVAASLRARAVAQGWTRSLPTAHPWQ